MNMKAPIIITARYKVPNIAPNAHHFPWDISSSIPNGDGPVPYGVIIPITQDFQQE